MSINSIITIICLMSAITILHTRCHQQAGLSDTKAEEELFLGHPHQRLLWPWIALPGIFLPGSASSTVTTGQPGEITQDPVGSTENPTSSASELTDEPGSIIVVESTESPIPVTAGQGSESTPDSIILAESTVGPNPETDPTTDSSTMEVETTTE